MKTCSYRSPRHLTSRRKKVNGYSILSNYLNYTAKFLNYTSTGFLTMAFNLVLVVVVGSIQDAVSQILSSLVLGQKIVLAIASIIMAFALMAKINDGSVPGFLQKWQATEAWTKLRYEVAFCWSLQSKRPLNLFLYWESYRPWYPWYEFSYSSCIFIPLAIALAFLPHQIFWLELCLLIPLVIIASWLVIYRYASVKRKQLGQQVFVLLRATYYDPTKDKIVTMPCPNQYENEVMVLAAIRKIKLLD